MTKLFGTDGIRGEAGHFPLDPKTIERFGYSLAVRLHDRLDRYPTIVIGRDTRISGPWIEEALIRGLEAGGAGWRSAHVIPTPGVAFLTGHLGADAGVVISASHNPFHDNGLKVFAPSGQKLDAVMEAAIERDIADSYQIPELPQAANAKPDPEDYRNLHADYLSYLSKTIASGLDISRLHIVVDCANGASYELAPALFRSLGARVTAISAEPDGRNINLDCGALHTQNLQKQVTSLGADFGIAFDGDADRSLFVDAGGRLVDGDQILFIIANYLAGHGNLSGNRVVATVMSNLGLELGLRDRGIELIRTNVGDKYVLDELLNNGGSIGGEQSGHIIFPEISLAGDGMITSIELLRSLTESGKTLADMAGGFIRYPQVIVNVMIKRKPPLESIPEISVAINDLVTRIEGQGRLLVRYSGTENLARIMIEGKDLHLIETEANQLADVLRANLG